MKNFLKTFTVTIPEGENESSLAAAGNAVTVYDTNSPFTIYDDAGSLFEIDRACRIESENGQSFTRLTLVRPKDFPGKIIVKMAVGSGIRFIDGRTQVSAVTVGLPVTDGASRLVGVLIPGDTLAGNAALSLPGIPPDAGCKVRKAVVISNDDPGNRLTVYDAAGRRCLRVQPLNTVRLDVSAPITVRNDNAAAVALLVGEIWYTV